ncbi:hypothetical protein Pcinc_000676 [Petrolisthes cinctipes]|uniref:Uncharacterized protein n=1 Tax=Petrolisthes cinctipes TaxID=88211 RepID=A0AAE1GLX7_PETCI|nr:hypothetical protein Pcinc_000676 [Petrolisthes cinctipes]
MTTLEPCHHYEPSKRLPLNDAHAPINAPRYTTCMPLVTPHFKDDHITLYLRATRPVLPRYATRTPLATTRSMNDHITLYLCTTRPLPLRYATSTPQAT